MHGRVRKFCNSVTLILTGLEVFSTSQSEIGISRKLWLIKFYQVIYKVIVEYSNTGCLTIFSGTRIIFSGRGSAP